MEQAFIFKLGSTLSINSFLASSTVIEGEIYSAIFILDGGMITLILYGSSNISFVLKYAGKQSEYDDIGSIKFVVPNNNSMLKASVQYTYYTYFDATSNNNCMEPGIWIYMLGIYTINDFYESDRHRNKNREWSLLYY